MRELGQKLHEIFESRVRENPDKIALIEGDKSITYMDLNELANQISWSILDKKVKPGDHIGVLLRHSIECIASILGIMKLGCVYVPLDIHSGIERKAYCIKDSNCNLVISEKKYFNDLANIVDIINVEDIDEMSRENPNLSLPDNLLAYVIYTSGTTGKPKGVEISQESLLYLLESLEDLFKDDSPNKIYFFNTPIVFDVSISEIYTWFYGGAYSLVVNDNELDFSIERLVNNIKENNVTRINVAPSLLNAIIDYIEKNNIKLESLKYIFSAGEELKTSLSNSTHLSLRDVSLVNLYGPTEATVYATYYETGKFENLMKIGIPFVKSEIVLVDNGKISDKKGEIYISGPGLARGYKNNEKLTEEAFVRLNYNGENRRFYKTGDLGEIGENNKNIIFLGRKDRQIKIRGIRLELGEVENTVSNLLKITQVAAIYKKEGSYKGQVVVFVKAHKDDKNEEILKKNLPRYMFPLKLVYVDEMPLSTSGKINYKKLENTIIDTKKLNPLTTSTERFIYKIFQEIFPRLTGEELDFDLFDLGGNSLLVAKLVSEVKKEFDIQIPFSQIYQSSNIVKIADYIDNNTKKNRKFIVEEAVRKYMDVDVEEVIINEKKYLIFFSDEKDEDKLLTIKKKLGNYFLPDYLIKKSLRDKIFEIETSKDLVLDMCDKARKFNRGLYEKLKEANIKKEYDTMNIQDFFISTNKKEILISVCRLEKISSLDTLKEALLEVLNSVGLFRAGIIIKDDRNTFIEKEKILDIDLDHIDLSRINPKDHQAIISQINDKLANSIYDHPIDNNFNDSLYRIVIYKLGFWDYEIDFIVDHKIFDGKSKSLIKNIIQKAINCRLDIDEVGYDTYVNYIDEISNSEKMLAYKDSGDYKKLVEVEKKLSVINNLVLGPSTIKIFEINNYSFIQNKYADFYETASLFLAIRLLKENFSFNGDINIRLTNNARSFREDFENIIGDFHFYSIMTVNSDLSLRELSKSISLYRENMFEKDKLFLDYMAHKKLKNEVFSQEIRSKYRTCKFAFNFIGSITETDLQMLKEAQKKPIEGYYLIMGFLLDDKIGLILPNGLLD